MQNHPSLPASKNITCCAHCHRPSKRLNAWDPSLPFALEQTEEQTCEKDRETGVSTCLSESRAVHQRGLVATGREF